MWLEQILSGPVAYPHGLLGNEVQILSSLGAISGNPNMEKSFSPKVLFAALLMIAKQCEGEGGVRRRNWGTVILKWSKNIEQQGEYLLLEINYAKQGYSLEYY